MTQFIYLALFALAGNAFDSQDYGHCLSLLSLVRPASVDHNRYFYQRAVCEYSLRLPKEARKSLDNLEGSFTELPFRYANLAYLMRAEMDTWKEGDLGDAARRMKEVTERITNRRAGPATQQKQKEVVSLLDKLIKDKEDAANRAKEAEQGGAGEHKPGPASGQSPAGPADDSHLPSASPGAGQVDPKRLKELAEAWGKLPEKDRMRAMNELTREMPPRHRELIQNYFRALQRGNR